MMQTSLTKIFFVSALLWNSMTAVAQLPWEVSVVFLGQGEDSGFQADVDENLMEMARLNPADGLYLSVLRLRERGAVAFHSSPRTRGRTIILDPLFHKPPVQNLKGWGQLWRGDLGESMFSEFFRQSFQLAVSQRLLIIYGHGLGYQGLKNLPLSQLKTMLEKHIPARGSPIKPLDILWMDSCYMSSAEVVTELSGLTRYYVGSQESEFSKGQPFQALNYLYLDSPNTEKAAIYLARSFLESYSLTERGSQSKAVETSSATISVVDTAKWIQFIGSISKLTETRPWGKIHESRMRRFEMDNGYLVDLGKSIELVAKTSDDSTAAIKARDLAKTLETSATKTRVSRVNKWLNCPETDCVAVFGFNGWQLGSKSDSETLNKLPATLRPEGFFRDNLGREWPFIKIKRRRLVAPLFPGVWQFDFHILTSGADKVLMSG
ncbi:MAG: clostripain-related cysteine peptidase, partial [Bdellovibrionaceae bacterium]|nr:clostripain-related cysteine peptidase [Pseudobdellovibrionaceae bacterium]